jgi:hypothetical protein
MTKNAFEETIKGIERRKAKWEHPGWFVLIISILVFIAGFLYKTSVLKIIGILFSAVGLYMIIMGRTVRKTILRK